MIRAVLVSATLAALIAMWRDRPAPVKSVQVDYCPVTKRVAQKEFLVRRDGSPVLDSKGEQVWRWHFDWAVGNAPCSQLDRYEQI